MPIIINGTTGISGNDGTAAVPTIQGSDANTGIYFPGNDRIAFTEGGVQAGEFDASGNFLFNSGYGSAAVAYGCRAWVNFSLPGTSSIRASGGISSIAQNGTGECTVNFSFTMPDANYIVVGGSMDNGVAYFVMPWIISQGTSSIRLQVGRFASSISNVGIVHLAFFR